MELFFHFTTAAAAVAIAALFLVWFDGKTFLPCERESIDHKNEAKYEIN